MSITQLFEGEGKCKPSFKESIIYHDLSYTDTNKENKKLLSFKDESQTYSLLSSTREINGCFLNKVESIDIESYVNDMENDGYQVFKYVINDLSIGENIITKSASDPCHNRWNTFKGSSRNSYSLATTIIKEVPIDVMISSEKIFLDPSSENILHLSFGKFYERDSDERKLEIKVNDGTGNYSWTALQLLQGQSIESEQTLDISYEQIVKSVSNGSDYYKTYYDLLAKNIEIRAVTKQLDGGITHGKIVTSQFYLKGPDFEILDVRSPSCGGIKIEIKLSQEDLYRYPARGFAWMVKIGQKTFKLDAQQGYDHAKGTYLLNAAKCEGTESMFDYLAKESIEKDQDCTIQLAIDSVDEYKFIDRKFTIPKRMKPVSASQISEDVDAVHSDLSNPCVLLSINDEDSSRESRRLSYDVYSYNSSDQTDEDGEFICSINSEITPIGASKTDYNNKNPDKSFDITFDSYTNKLFFEDIYSKINTEYKSIIRIGETTGAQYGDTYDWKNEDWIVLKNVVKDSSGNVLKTYICCIPRNFWPTASLSNYYNIHKYVFAGNVDCSANNAVVISTNKNIFLDNEGSLTFEEIVHDGPSTKHNTIVIPVQNIYDPTGNASLTYLGKGNGYYFIRYSYGSTNVYNLLNCKTLATINSHLKEGAIDCKNCVTYVINNNLIGVKDINTKKVFVWNIQLQREYHTIGNNVDLYSIEAVDGGFRYRNENVCYYCKFSEYNSIDLLLHFKKGNTLFNVNGYESYDAFEKKWVKFDLERNSNWIKYLSDYYYKVGIVRKTDFIKDSKKSPAYSGFLRIKDKDECYSDNIEYFYRYVDDKYTSGNESQEEPDDGTEEIVSISSDGLGTVINKNKSIKIIFSPQTCNGEGGRVDLSYIDAAHVTYDRFVLVENKNDYISTNLLTISNIKVGDYKLYGVKNNERYLLSENIKINNKAFDVVVKGIAASEIGMDGSAVISVENLYSRSIVWENLNGLSIPEVWDNSNGTKVVKARCGSYDVTAIANGSCRVQNQFNVLQAGINFTEAEIKYNNKSHKASIYFVSSKVGIIDSYSLCILDSKYDDISAIKKKAIIDIANGSCSGNEFSYTTGETYYLYVIYTINGTTRYYCLTPDGITPPNITECDAIADTEYNSNRCYGSVGRILLQGDCLFYEGNKKIEPTKEASFNYYEVGSGVHHIFIEKVGGSAVLKNFKKDGINSINQVITDERIVTINEVEKPRINLSAEDVTCKGRADGRVYVGKDIDDIANIKTSRNQLQLALSFGNGAVGPFNDVVSNLSPGLHSIIIKDGSCFYEPFHIEIEEPQNEISVYEKINDPSCSDDDGTITVTPSGGWGRYIMSVDEDIVSPKSEEEFERNKTYISPESLNKSYIFRGEQSGEHTIYVLDGNFCKYTKDITLKKYTNPSVLSAQTDSVSCYGLSDGVIKGIEVKTNGSLNGNAVSVTEMKYWKVGKEDAAEGEKDAELEKSDEKGWIPYSESIHDLKAGTYKILLKDNNECESGEYSIEVKEPDGIQLAVEPKYKYYGEDGTEKGKIKSYGGDDGEIKVRVDGGNYGYKYVIVEANTTQVPTSTYNSIGNLSAQKYTVIATDNKNCPSNSVDVELVAPLTPLKVEINTTAALCRSRVGSATVAVEGGWSDYKIDLVGEHETRSTVGKTVTYEGLYAGKYELHVTDDMGVTLDTVLVISSPEPISYTYDITPEVCEENTGVIKIEFEDEDPQCKLFFGGQEYDVEEREIRFENLSSNKAGGYVMTIVDKNECESELTFEVPDNKMTVSIEDRYEVNKGVMSAVVDHGAAPYMYKWEYMSGSNEMGTESSFATDKNGIYHLTVTDVNGCTREKTHSLLLEGDRRFIVEEVHRETAFEKKDGLVKLRCEEDEITVERLYIYIGEEKKELKDVKKDGSSYIIDDLAGGDYSVEGILANGCKVLADFHIKSYEKMDADVVILRHVSRPKYSDGVINVDVTGGIAPYTVRISTEVGDNVGDEMETAGRLQIDNLQAGIYTLSITDSTENVLTLENYEIKEPAPIKVTSTDKRANCYNEKSAEAKIMAEGGWPGYQYADAKDGVYKNSNIFTELPAGRRKFYVIDKYGVVDSIFVRLTEPDELRATVAAIDSVKCKGDSNGSILFEVTGGTPEYKTLMLNNGIAYDMRDQVGWDNLSSGYYTATFTDYNRCETPDTIEFYIPEPDSLEVALMDVVHTTCELDNGKISIRMKGGSLPYKYEWAENGEVYTKNKNIGLTLTQAEGLLQNGLYRVEIRDSHDCYAKTEDVRIAESHNPSIKQDGVQTIDALCKNSSDGTAFVDSTDIIIGIPASPFKLMWPQGQSGVMKVNTLPAGRYEVEIRDDNNCHTTTEFTIEEPDSVSNRLVGLRNALCYGYSDGRIETATIGGVGGYSYLWNTGETTTYLDSIKAGEYTVVVKDAHGCEHVASYEITEPEELKVYLGEDVLICPKGVHVFDGGEYTTYSWRKVATGEEIETGRYMATGEDGDYAIKVTNAIGCIARDTVNLSIGENALIANFLMASDAAVNDTIELIELSNMPIDSLRWVYNTDIFSDVTPYGAGRDRLDILAGETGSYYITMWAYSGGCESFEDKHIDICEALDKDADFEIGYDPIIQSVKATPNPNDGEFNLIVKLREEYDVTVTINSVNTGQQIEKLELKGADNYNHRLNIRDWGSGMYVLSVFVGDERRAVKVVSTR